MNDLVLSAVLSLLGLLLATLPDGQTDGFNDGIVGKVIMYT